MRWTKSDNVERCFPLILFFTRSSCRCISRNRSSLDWGVFSCRRSLRCGRDSWRFSRLSGFSWFPPSGLGIRLRATTKISGSPSSSSYHWLIRFDNVVRLPSNRCMRSSFYWCMASTQWVSRVRLFSKLLSRWSAIRSCSGSSTVRGRSTGFPNLHIGRGGLLRPLSFGLVAGHHELFYLHGIWISKILG